MAKRSPISRRQANQSSEEDSSEESGGVSSSEEDVTDIDVEVCEESDESNGIR